MPEQRLDEPLLPEPEVPVDASVREPVQPPDRLFREQFFQFVSRHRMLVIGQQSMVNSNRHSPCVFFTIDE
jgi:hypothetical protein